jgi:hypothetical protein
MANATMAMMSCLRVVVAVLAARVGSAAKSVDSAPGGVAAAIRGPADHRHPNRRVGAEPQDKGQLLQSPPTRRDRKNPFVSPARRSLRLCASVQLYQDARSFGSGTVSLTISHRSEWQTLLNALASLFRNTTMSSGWNATTKSLSSCLIDTRRRGGNLPNVAALSTDICNPRTTDQRARSVAAADAKPLALAPYQQTLIRKRD